MSYPRIGIFNGQGASHSWLWFVDLFEKAGSYDLVFLDENQIQQGNFRKSDCLAFSGGDTITMAEGLGASGAAHLSDFIRQGGLYLGSCAGAYLPLNSSKEHLNCFNFVEAKITNLTAEVPPSLTLPQKSITPYGCSFVFHPVREEVVLSSTGVFPFSQEPFLAPLYGGPGLTAMEPCQILAHYSGFTSRTRFLVDRHLAYETLIGKGAVVRRKLGQGHLYLFGPHFEHPHFPEANHRLHQIMRWELGKEPRSQPRGEGERTEQLFRGQGLSDLIKPLKRAISHARIVAQGLEMTDVYWVIGHKIYEPVKIRVFLEAIWKRILKLEKHKRPLRLTSEDLGVVEKAEVVTQLVRSIKEGVEVGRDTGAEAAALFDNLQSLCRMFLTLYFRSELCWIKGN